MRPLERAWTAPARVPTPLHLDAAFDPTTIPGSKVGREYDRGLVDGEHALQYRAPPAARVPLERPIFFAEAVSTKLETWLASRNRPLAPELFEQRDSSERVSTPPERSLYAGESSVEEFGFAPDEFGPIRPKQYRPPPREPVQADNFFIQQSPYFARPKFTNPWGSEPRSDDPAEKIHSKGAIEPPKVIKRQPIAAPKPAKSRYVAAPNKDIARQHAAALRGIKPRPAASPRYLQPQYKWRKPPVVTSRGYYDPRCDVKPVRMVRRSDVQPRRKAPQRRAEHPEPQKTHSQSQKKSALAIVRKSCIAVHSKVKPTPWNDGNDWGSLAETKPAKSKWRRWCQRNEKLLWALGFICLVVFAIGFVLFPDAAEGK